MSNLTNLRAIDAGVDNIDTSISSMSMGVVIQRLKQWYTLWKKRE